MTSGGSTPEQDALRRHAAGGLWRAVLARLEQFVEELGAEQP